MNWRWLLFLQMSVCAVQTAAGAWLGVCSGESPNPTARLLAEYASPQKMRTSLFVDSMPLPNCAAVELPFAAQAVITGRLVSPGLGNSLGSGFGLLGRMHEQRFQVSEIVPYSENVAVPPIPLGVELGGQLVASAFGIEGRASVWRHNGHITLDCSAGKRTAGMILRMPFRGLPRAIALSVSVSYSANGDFESGLSDTSRATLGDPLPLAKLSAASDTFHIDVPEKQLDVERVESLTITCPESAAKFELDSLQFDPKHARPVVTSHALWVWQSAAWMQSPEALLNKLAKANVDTLYVNVPIDVREAKVAQSRELEDFVNAASKRGVRVWAVVGDPGAVIDSERAVFARYPVAYARYNLSVPATAKLAGVQFDIEPYLNPGYALDPAAWYEAYLETLLQLKQAAVLPIDVVVPYWWADQQTAGGSLMDRLAPVVDSVTMMNYRTEPALIKRFAQPFLEWGARYRRAVHIALESGPIPDEVQQHYRPARQGEVALISFSPHLALLEFDRALSFPESFSKGQTFLLSHATPVSGNATTFAGRRDALLKLLPELERLWSAWPCFAGAALHEFEP